jgi:DNA mismatch repair protein MutS
MKKAYQIAEKKDTRKLAEFLSREGQLLLPMLDLITRAEMAVDELIDLAEQLPHVVNYNVAVAEEGEEVVFLHKVVPGGADKSYGIHVARLAGLPRQVIVRAQEILDTLEKRARQEKRRVPSSRPLQLPLFTMEHPVLEELKEIDINSMTPLDALNKLYQLQKKLEEK